MLPTIKHLSPKRITGKVFLITAVTLVTLALVFYALLYLFLPSFYEQYKIQEVDEQIERIVLEATEEEATFQETYEQLEALSWNQNVYFYLLDENFHPLFSLNARTFEVEDGLGNRTTAVQPPTLEGFLEGYSQTVPITIEGREFHLFFNASLQPVSEATEALFLFLPYILIVAIILSIGCAYFFSRQITKPLLKLNASAQSLARLDFSKTIKHDSDDEIGELSKSINQMSNNLEQTLLELKSANEKLQSDIEREREIEERRREYFSAASHELKSPITILKGQMEGMIHNIGPYQDRDHYLRKSLNTTEEMETLVQNMMQLSRFERDLLNQKQVEIDLVQVIQTTLHKLEYFREEKNMTMKVTLPDEQIVIGNEELLKRMLYSVIHNGYMYSPAGGNLTVSIKESGDETIVTVNNDGVTLSEEEQDMIFKPFYRVEKSRNRHTGGSGIGLYLVSQMAKALDVRYDVSSSENDVTFRFTFQNRE